ncbi:MAG: hypothetical protein R3F49_23940 [Planctomycetota bacterium]
MSTILLCAVALQSFTLLSSASETDGDRALFAFNAQGTELFIGNSATANVSRHDISTGARLAVEPTSSTEGTLSLPVLALGGSQVLVTTRDGVDRFSASDLSHLGTFGTPAPTGVVGYSYSLVDSNSSRAFLVRQPDPQQPEVDVFDLTTGALLTSHDVVSVVNNQSPAPANFVLAYDDRTLVYVENANSPSPAEAVAYDMVLGAEVSRVVLPGRLQWQRLESVKRSRDGRRLIVRTGGGFSTGAHLTVLDLPSLNLVGSFSAPASENFDTFDMDDAGRYAITVSEQGLERLDFVTGQRLVLEPGIEFPAWIAVTPGGVLTLKRGGPSFVHDIQTGTRLGAFPDLGDLPWSPNSLAGLTLGTSPKGHLRIVKHPGSSRVAVGALFDRERVVVIDVAGAQTQAVATLGIAGDGDADAPIHLADVDGSDLLVALCEDSNTLRLMSGAIERGVVSTGERPIAVTVVDGRWAAVICRAARTLEIFDLGSMTRSGVIPLAGAPRELDREGSRVWIRVEGAIDALVGYELSGGTPTSVGSVPLQGSGGPFIGIYKIETVVIDAPRRLAYVADADRALVQRVDLASSSVTAERAIPGSNLRPHLALNPSGERLSVSHRVLENALVSGYDELPSSFSSLWTVDLTSTEGSYSGHAAFVSDTELLVATGVNSGRSLVDSATGAAMPLHPLQRSANIESNGGLVATIANDSSISSREFALERFVGGTPQWIAIPNTPNISTPRPMPMLVQESISRVVMAGAVSPYMSIADLAGDYVGRFCSPAASNISGQPATLEFSGSMFAGNRTTIGARGLSPQSNVGYLLVGDAQALPMIPPGSIGQLCLGGRIGRYINQVQAASMLGAMSFEVDTSALPFSSGAVGIGPFEPLFFQLWYRDSSLGAPTSNFSDMIGVLYR